MSVKIPTESKWHTHIRLEESLFTKGLYNLQAGPGEQCSTSGQVTSEEVLPHLGPMEQEA